MAEQLDFVAVYRPADGGPQHFSGEVRKILSAINFVEASQQAETLEAKLDPIGFTLFSIEYLG